MANLARFAALAEKAGVPPVPPPSLKGGTQRGTVERKETHGFAAAVPPVPPVPPQKHHVPTQEDRAAGVTPVTPATSEGVTPADTAEAKEKQGLADAVTPVTPVTPENDQSADAAAEFEEGAVLIPGKSQDELFHVVRGGMSRAEAERAAAGQPARPHSFMALLDESLSMGLSDEEAAAQATDWWLFPEKS